MNSIIINLGMSDLNFVIFYIKTIFIIFLSFISAFKISNLKINTPSKYLHIFLFSNFTFLPYFLTKYIYPNFPKMLILIIAFCISLTLLTKKSIFHSIVSGLISLSLNYTFLFTSIFVNYVINIFILIDNDIINLSLILIMFFVIWFLFFRLKKFKYGFSFMSNINNTDSIDIFCLNIAITILFLYIVVINFNAIKENSIFAYFIILFVIMFITIQKSITLYYKHNLLEKELNDLKAEVENKNKEIAELEKENLDFIKSSHSIAHKQKSLEYKINKLQNSCEFADELDITDEFNKIANANSSVVNYSLAKTGITEIDDMLEFLQSECSTNNINFDLILSGNIHYIINNYISIDNLQILLADHIKDAIIAIKNSDNINRSILVKIGLFDNVYSIHIFDSGIEFEIDTFNKLGTQPVTTHSKDGGTGLGFMNTFDTLNKTSASLCINEIGKPFVDNFTKEIIISFDNLHKLEIKSYRFTDLSNTLKNSNFEILNND